jgi:hypothetical protein
MLWGFAAGLLLLGALVLTNLRRAHHTPHFDLKPNVLLTRYPLVFVSGHRSLFYFLGCLKLNFLTGIGHAISKPKITMPGNPSVKIRYQTTIFYLPTILLKKLFLQCAWVIKLK